MKDIHPTIRTILEDTFGTGQRGNAYFEDALKDIEALLEKELLQDEVPHAGNLKVRNILRQEQRTALKKLIGGHSEDTTKA